MTLRDALLKAFGENEEKPAGAVLDTWFLAALATHEIHAEVTAHWLNQQRIVPRVTWDVEKEYNRFFETQPVILDDEGVPKAPIGLESMLYGISTSLAVRAFSAKEKDVVSNPRLSLPDKMVALEARILAERHGSCYLVTNDTELIGKSGQRFGRVIEENHLNITVVMPSYIREHFAHLLPELNLRYLVTGKAMADLYKLGTGQQQQPGQPYLHVVRSQPFRFGRVTIVTDLASEVRVLEPGKRLPARTKDYAIPVMTVKDGGQEEREAAILSLKTHIKPKKLHGFKFAVATGSAKYLPTFFQIRREKSEYVYESARWARIPAFMPAMGSKIR